MPAAQNIICGCILLPFFTVISEAAAGIWRQLKSSKQEIELMKQLKGISWTAQASFFD